MNPSPLDLLLVTLAVWRLASLLVRERGPFDLFLRLRTRAGITPDDEGRPLTWNESCFWAAVLSCLWCCSIWLGAGAAAALWIAPSATVWLSMPLALSAGALLVDRMMSHG